MSAQEHQPEAERKNRTIKECCRIAFHRLPFKTIPQEMIKCLVLSATDQLNYFPARGGISDTLSPRVILGQGNLNYNKHCKYSFGAYVQPHDKTNERNTQPARTLESPDRDEDFYSPDIAPLIAQFIVHTHDTTIQYE